MFIPTPEMAAAPRSCAGQRCRANGWMNAATQLFWSRRDRTWYCQYCKTMQHDADNTHTLADVMEAEQWHELTIQRVGEIFGAEEGTPEGEELSRLVEQVLAYERISVPPFAQPTPEEAAAFRADQERPPTPEEAQQIKAEEEKWK